MNQITEKVQRARDEYRLGIVAHLSDSDLQALAQCRGVRPCVVNADEKPAKFICWLYREWSYTPVLVNAVPTRECGMFAFVELDGGTMATVPADKVRFTDV